MVGRLWGFVGVDNLKPSTNSRTFRENSRMFRENSRTFRFLAVCAIFSRFFRDFPDLHFFSVFEDKKRKIAQLQNLGFSVV